MAEDELVLRCSIYRPSPKNLPKRKVVFSVSTRVVVGIKETMEMGGRRKLEMELKQDEKLVMGLDGELGRGK